MNKVILMGRLTRDPEVRYSQGAEPKAIARYSLAVNRRFKRQEEQDADFIPCVAFGKQGEFAEKYLSKGRLIAVSGRLQVRNWEDNNGNKRTTIEVVAEEQYFAESKKSNAENGWKRENDGIGEGFYPINDDVKDDDLPF